MTLTVDNPYTGEAAETCSVSFAAQQKMAATGVSGSQTEAEHNKSKLLGEWGVIKGKAASGQIPAGTKLFRVQGSTVAHVLTWNGDSFGWRSYNEKNVMFKETKGKTAQQIHDAFFGPNASPTFKFTVLGKEPTKAEGSIQAITGLSPDAKITNPLSYWGDLEFNKDKLTNGQVLAISDSEIVRVLWAKGKHGDMEWHVQEADDLGNWSNIPGQHGDNLDDAGYAIGDLGYEDAMLTPLETKAPKPAAAAPSPAPPVPQGSSSPGSMTDEDVATLFVTVKDTLAKEKGLNIKGANPALDAEVYKAIGDQTGYTAAEAKGKVDAYKATGKKLSALKKKTLKSPAKVQDPKPNDVPTVATTQVADAVTEAVIQVAEDKPKSVYSNEDIAAQFVIHKDAIVAASGGKWTLYTKSDEMDLEIAIQVGLKTGLNIAQQKQAIAEYLSTGKKLSGLKKTLIKQGKLKPEADTLKKADPAKKVNTPDPGQTATEAKAEAEHKADTAYSPPEAPQSGEIAHLSPIGKSNLFLSFKNQMGGNFQATPAANYEALLRSIEKMNAGNDPAMHNLTPLQALRVLDEHGSIKFNKPNEQRYEKKVVEWLTTPEGKAQSQAIHAKLLEEKLQKEQASALLEEAAAGQPPLPEDSALFSVISATRAAAVHKVMQSENPWTEDQKSAITKYTGSSYTEMNNHLRGKDGGSASLSVKSAVQHAIQGMRPTPEAILLHRGAGTGRGQFGVTDDSQFWGLTGKLLEEKGFLSTSVGGRAAFGSTKALLEVEVPKGTMGAYVKSISSHKNEDEFILKPGTKYRVLRVTQVGHQFVVRVRVESQ